MWLFDISGVIESCLKLEERLLSESSESSDCDVVGSGEFEMLVVVDLSVRRRV